MCHNCRMTDSSPSDLGPDGDRRTPTVLEIKPAHQLAFVVVLAVLGLALGVAAPFLLRWADGVEWLPFGGQRRLLEKLAGRVGSWILIVVGGVVGALVGLGITAELTKITITDEDVRLVKGSKTRRFSRAQVTKALYDDKHLVLRDDTDADLIREKLDVERADVLAALRAHGWPLA